MRFHQLDARRVSAARPAFRDRVPHPDGGVAAGWETTDGSPVYRLQNLSSPDTGRSAFVHPGLPQNLRPPGGARALIRHGPGQSQSVYIIRSDGVHDPKPHLTCREEKATIILRTTEVIRLHLLYLSA